MPGLAQLISHRFRGFAPRENTIEGLTAALDFGVELLEFDVRMTRCGTPIIYHDEYALDKIGKKHFLADVTASQLQNLGGTFVYMPEADDFFRTASEHANKSARLLVDIKDLGFETEINALVHQYGLQDRVVYVSWIPEVLYRLHDIAPAVPLCLSHWCQSPSAPIRAKHIVSTSKNGEIPRNRTPYIHGERRGWFVKNGLKGNLLDIIKSSLGYICVPQDMITRELSDYYHDHGIRVSTFSYVDLDHINAHAETFNIDLYFIDNKTVFETIS